MRERRRVETHLHSVPPATDERDHEHRGSSDRGSDRLDRLYRKHHGQVLGAAYRLTGSVTDAEDVLQTVFSRLLRRMPEEDLGRGWAPYLHRAAVNAAIDVLRTRNRWSVLEEPDLEPGLSAPDTEAETHLREQKARLRQALSRETPRSAAIFALRFFEGYRNKEIAEVVGVSRTLVAVTLHRVRARLKKELGDES